jgi:glutamate/aspartate transport system substrate-binding protein
MLRFALLLMLGLVPVLTHAQVTFDKIKGRGQILIGYRVDAAPFSYLDAKKQPIGYSLEFCNAIAAKVLAQPGMAKLKIAYMEVPVDRMTTYVGEGSVDLFCSGTSDTAERRNQMAFSRPIFFGGLGMMVRKKDGVTGLDQLKGKKVVLLKGTTATGTINDYLKKSGGAWKLEEAVGGDAALSQLQLGWVAGYARDRVLLAVQRAGLSTPDDYVILPDQLSNEAIAIAYRRDDAAMKAVVDGVVGEAAASGKAQEWYDKWFTKPIPLGSANKSLDIPMSSELKAAFSKK